MLIIFYTVVLILLYHIFFYGFILKIFSSEKPSPEKNIQDYPTITVLCPAYNEELVIESKIMSFLRLDYPKDRIKLIVISDDSTDNTNEIVRRFEEKGYIELVVQSPRRGKPSGHNLVQPGINSDYIVSTDANSIFDSQAMKELVKTMNTSSNVGMVVGKLKLVKNNGQDSGEGLYWKYESWLKSMDSRFYSVICANGSLFMVKRELFTQIHPTSVDDFERTLIVLKKGYIAKYCPDAFVTEDVTEKPSEEIKRKIRIISREWSALSRQREVLNFFKFPEPAFLLASHKLIRWLLPLFSLLLLVSNCFLLNTFFYRLIFLGQIFVYLSGLIELQLEKCGKGLSPLKLTAYWVAMNYAALMAILISIKGTQQTMWSTKRN